MFTSDCANEFLFSVLVVALNYGLNTVVVTRVFRIKTYHYYNGEKKALKNYPYTLFTRSKHSGLAVNPTHAHRLGNVLRCEISSRNSHENETKS